MPNSTSDSDPAANARAAPTEICEHDLRARISRLAAECRAWRAAQHLRIDEPHHEFVTLAEARAVVDAHGDLDQRASR